MASCFLVLDRRRAQTAGIAREYSTVIGEYAVETGGYVLATLMMPQLKEFIVFPESVKTNVSVKRSNILRLQNSAIDRLLYLSLLSVRTNYSDKLRRSN